MDIVSPLLNFGLTLGAILVALWLVSAVKPVRGLATVLARRVIEDLKNQP